MKVYFENSNGKRRLISDEIKTRKEAFEVINKFLVDHNYTSYYTRMWCDNEGWTWFDVGSHTEFFICDENLMESESDV